MFRRTLDRRRSPLLRLISLASALSLVLAGATDAYGLHRCAHHDALPGESAAGTTDHGAHAAVPGDAHATSHQHGAPQSGEHESGCTCVGHCAGAPGIATPDGVGTSELQLECSSECATPPAADAPRPDHASHFLPFAQAPPLAR